MNSCADQPIVQPLCAASCSTASCIASPMEAMKNTMIGALFALCKTEFGPFAPAAVVVTLVALSGLTRAPAAIRTVGTAACHWLFGLFAEAVLGPTRATFATSVTESVLLDYGRESDVKTFLFYGQLRPSPILDIFARNLRAEPSRHLDMAPGETLRARSLQRPLALILLGADEIRDRVLLESLVSIRLNDSPDAQHHDWQRQQRAWASSRHCAPMALANDAIQGMRHAIEHRPWDGPIAIESNSQPAISPRNRIDQARTRFVISLATVCAVLRENPIRDPATCDSAVLPTIYVRRLDIAFVIQLLDQLRVEDDRTSLTSAQLECLRVVQRIQSKSSQSGLGGVVPSSGNTPQNTADQASFTIKQLQRTTAFSSLTVQSIHDRVNGLESLGFVERTHKVGRQTAYQLTQRGLAYRRCSLATFAAQTWGIDLQAALQGEK